MDEEAKTEYDVLQEIPMLKKNQCRFLARGNTYYDIIDGREGHVTPTISKTLPRRKNVKAQPKLYKLNTELIESILRRDDREVERLLNVGANADAITPCNGISACHLAALVGGEALSLLQMANARMLRSDVLGRNPLYYAAWAGNIEQIAILLNIPIEIRSKIKHNVTPEVVKEIEAINYNFKELANFYCFGKSSVNDSKNCQNEMDYNCSKSQTNLPMVYPKWTPLHAASANAHIECVRLLLAAGADPNMRDHVNRSALDVAGFAYYNGRHNINPEHFLEVIKLLLEVNPNNNNLKEMKRTKQDTTLHTAVEIGSMEAITMLLDAGASVLSLNRNGLTPLHICAENKLKEHLQILLNYNKDDSEEPIIDVIDKSGQTVLHVAVINNWIEGVCVAQEAGANIFIKDFDGNTAIHLAATQGNLDILCEIIANSNIKDVVNCQNNKNKTALFNAVENDHVECVTKMLEIGASIKVTMPKKFSVFHAAAQKGQVEILKVLLNHNDVVTRNMINITVEDSLGLGPIHYAVRNNHTECVELLLSKNADVKLRTWNKQDLLPTALHIAAHENNFKIAKILVKYDASIVHDVNYLECTPLHIASRYQSRDVIEYLLCKGADLAAVTNDNAKFRKTAVDIIMNNLSKPTEFLEAVFDSCIYSKNDLNLHDPNCIVGVNYNILQGGTSNNQTKTTNKGQMTVVQAIIATDNRQKQHRLLLHPLIESFLYLRWRALLPFFCVIVFVYSAFVISFTTLILSNLYYTDRGTHYPSIFHPEVWSKVAIVSLTILIIQEICYYQFSQRYFGQFDTWIKLITIFLALFLLIYHKEASAPDMVSYRHIATVVILLSWVELMFLLSDFPMLGYYVPMFTTVSSNVLKIFLTFIFLIIGFSLSFMIQFHAKDPFASPFAAIVKTIVMMTSEFDFDDLITNIQKVKGLSPSILTIHILFVGFLIFAAIVLMNLMVGVAVNDLRNLEILGNIKRIHKHVEFLAFLENLSNSRPFNKFIAKKFLEKHTKKEITLRPCEKSCEYYKKLPARVRNAIFDIVQAHKQRTKKELDSKTLNKKLDEIYHTIVENCNDSDKDNNIESVVADLKEEFKRMQDSIETLNMKTNKILNKLDKLCLLEKYIEEKISSGSY